MNGMGLLVGNRFWLQLLTLISALLIGGLAVACGGGEATGEQERAREIVITATDFDFQPDTITIKRGEPVRIVLNNTGAALHDFTVMVMPAEVISEEEGAEHDMGEMMAAVHVAAEPGSRASIEFIPTRSGTYTFFCSVTGHRELGMEGRLIVED